jgi:hypothetical protein
LPEDLVHHPEHELAGAALLDHQADLLAQGQRHLASHRDGLVAPAELYRATVDFRHARMDDLPDRQTAIAKEWQGACRGG